MVTERAGNRHQRITVVIDLRIRQQLQGLLPFRGRAKSPKSRWDRQLPLSLRRKLVRVIKDAIAWHIPERQGNRCYAKTLPLRDALVYVAGCLTGHHPNAIFLDSGSAHRLEMASSNDSYRTYCGSSSSCFKIDNKNTRS
ncbi:Tyrosine--tRNA ligase, cytoplasmic [Fusarium oxysporum f. sp. albedinis]|nr:Tyrosine--tRNA ligase, cytoplasmic [Fusarium oxysporum f. sp. albedinis]